MAVPIPDYTTLAQQQAGLNQQQASYATNANRANQVGPTGSLTWSQDPNTGQWTQTSALNPTAQSAQNGWEYGQEQGNAQANWLLNRGGNSGSNSGTGGGLGAGVDNVGLSDWGSSDITNGVSAMPDGGYAASQQVIDATRALQQPALQQQQDAERTRLAAMGITMGSDASNSSERNLSNAASDADMKAILAGTTEAGNVFNRQLAQRQQGVNENTTESNLATALRGNQLGERTAIQGSNMATLAGLKSGLGAINPTYASYAGATVAPAADIYGAARDIYGAAVGQENANLAQGAQNTANTMGMLGLGIKALGTPAVTNGISNAWDTASNWFGGNSSAAGGGDTLGAFGDLNNWWGTA